MKMTKTCSVVLSAALLTMSAATSRAGSVLVSPILPSSINSATLDVCQALNASTKPLEVTMDIVNSADASILATSTVTLGAGGNLTLNANGSAMNTFCRATGLSAKSGRLSYIATDGPGNILMAVTNP